MSEKVVKTPPPRKVWLSGYDDMEAIKRSLQKALGPKGCRVAKIGLISANYSKVDCQGRAHRRVPVKGQDG